MEIGPLASPVVQRSSGRIYYADHCSTQDLRRKYAEAGRVGTVDLSALAEVDLVLGGRSLREALGDRAPVDYVVASHVLEHLPDPVGWLVGIAECLRDGGRLCLAIPDKRFTFDRYRHCTMTREIVEWYLRGEKVPTAGQVFDQYSRAAKIDEAAVWRGEIGPRIPVDGHFPAAAIGLAREAAARPTYLDVHCTVFTPYSFTRVLRDLMEIDLLPYEVASLEPTARNEIEFFITLRKRTGCAAEARIATVPLLDPSVHDALPPTAGGDRGPTTRREPPLVRRLRRLLATARRRGGRVERD